MPNKLVHDSGWINNRRLVGAQRVFNLGLCYLVLLFSSLSCNASDIVLADNFNNATIYEQLKWYIDPDGDHQPPELLATPELFSSYSSLPQPINPGRLPMWFRFTVDNPTQEVKDLVLTARDSTRLSGMKLYSISNSVLREKSVNKLPHRLSIYSIQFDIEPGATREYLGYWPAHIHQYPANTIRLVDLDLFHEEAASQLAIAYATIGVIFGLTLYNIFLFLFTREYSYIYYAGFVAFAGLFFSMTDEVGHQLLSSIDLRDDIRGRVLWWSILPSILGLSLFSREFIETKIRLKRADVLLKLIISLLALLTLFGFYIDHDVLRLLAATSVVIVFTVLLALGLIIWRKGHQQARLYVLAFGVLFSMALLAIFAELVEQDRSKALLYLEFTRHGLIFSLILLSIAMADRIQIMKQQQIKISADARAARETAELKGHFLATMSHEIRTPMNGVIGIGQIIKDKAESKYDSHLADILLSSADTLLNVVNDILDLSKIEAGKLRINNQAFSIGEVFAYVGALFYELNKNPELHFSVEIDSSLPNFLIGDQQRVKQILYNLISNAFKFTERGHVLVSCKSLAAVTGGGQRAGFVISDTGIGISQSDQARLFNAYEQADKSSTRQHGGTGLGLSISRQLVELMDGDMGVRSEPGVGSEFWFNLNFEVDEDKERERVKTTRHIKGKKIALFYVMETLAKNTMEQLEKVGAKVELYFVKIGEELPVIKDVDVVLASDHLGDFLKDIIKQCETAAIPMVISRSNTGHFDEGWIRGSRIHFVYIPLTQVEIEYAIAEALSGGEIITPVQEYARTETDLASLNILIVEDNATNQLIIKSLLGRLNQNISVVENGQKAVSAYLERPDYYKLILMDCEMPLMDGYEATEKIRRYEAEQNIPPVFICALTAHAMDDNYQRCISVGMNDVLIKPIKIEQLRKVISTLSPAIKL